MNRQQGDITVIGKANSTSESLRTTIPMSITKQFKLKERDHLKWEIKAKESKLFVVVTPLSQ